MTTTSVWRGLGEECATTSALDGRLLHQTTMLSLDQLQSLAGVPAPIDSPFQTEAGLTPFLSRLASALERRRTAFIDAMRHETGFIPSDCEEVFGGVLALLRGFCANLPVAETPRDDVSAGRSIRLASAPWGSVAVILPQNAFLYLAVTCLASAMSAGNRVTLRAPGQSSLSAEMLAEALRDAGADLDQAAVVMAKSKEFIGAFQNSTQPCMIHYMGSSRHAPAILSDCFQAGKATLIDGDGNVVVYVGPNACPDDAADVLAQGAIRYNGQTCTSINGAVIHPALYAAVRGALLRRWGELTFGNTLDTRDVSVGPLLSPEQALWCEQRIAESGGTILQGGSCVGNILAPSLLENPELGSDLVRQGLFGPALWIAAGDAGEFVHAWRRNQYPLCAAIFGAAEPIDWWLPRLPGMARLVVDGDPSIEDIFEPWGGYLGSGSNPVSDWRSKYRRTLQIDAPMPA